MYKMYITELIEEINVAGYKPHHDFPNDYYVKEYISEEGIKQYVIITIHETSTIEPYEFAIAHAGPDWIEPVDFFCSPNHNKFSISDTILEADKILLKNEG